MWGKNFVSVIWWAAVLRAVYVETAAAFDAFRTPGLHLVLCERNQASAAATAAYSFACSFTLPTY